MYVYIYIHICKHVCSAVTNNLPSPPVCKSINAKLGELQETTKSLCGANATKPWTFDMAAYRHLVTWTSVDFTQIGSTNFRSTGTLSFEIPALIPDDAIEVLLYAYFYSAGSSGPHSHFKIYTEGDDGEEYAKYITLLTGASTYYYVNTDNLWFPMTSSRRVFLNVPNSLSGNSIHGYLYVIGYR